MDKFEPKDVVKDRNRKRKEKKHYYCKKWQPGIRTAMPACQFWNGISIMKRFIYPLVRNNFTRTEDWIGQLYKHSKAEQVKDSLARTKNG